jgi:cytochrome c
MIARGKIIYESYCVSCHQVNLIGAENWKGVDEDGHRKAPPLNGTGHTWHHMEIF